MSGAGLSGPPVGRCPCRPPTDPGVTLTICRPASRLGRPELVSLFADEPPAPPAANTPRPTGYVTVMQAARWRRCGEISVMPALRRHRAKCRLSAAPPGNRVAVLRYPGISEPKGLRSIRSMRQSGDRLEHAPVPKAAVREKLQNVEKHCSGGDRTETIRALSARPQR